MTDTPALHRYVVTHVDDALADRVHVGSIMVDKKRHTKADDGWTSWHLHNRNTGVTSRITAWHIGRHVEGESCEALLRELVASLPKDADQRAGVEAALEAEVRAAGVSS